MADFTIEIEHSTRNPQKTLVSVFCLLPKIDTLDEKTLKIGTQFAHTKSGWDYDQKSTTGE